MLSLFGRLAVSLVLLMGFSVFAAWAWDRSDQTQAGAKLRTTQQGEAILTTAANTQK